MLVEVRGEAGGGEYGASTQDNPCTQKGLARWLAACCIREGEEGRRGAVLLPPCLSLNRVSEE